MAHEDAGELDQFFPVTRDKPRTLLQIADDMLALDAALSELPDGEMTPEAEKALTEWFQQIEQNREAKIDGYCALIREATLRAEARSNESKRLALLAATDANKAERLKERLKYYFAVTGTKKVDTARFRVSLCNNGGKQSVAVNCPVDALPDYFVRTVKSADIDAIRENLEAGVPVPGCELKPRGTHLRLT